MQTSRAKNSAKSDHTYTVAFTDKALEKLRELAHDYGLKEDNLGELLHKGIRMLMVAKDGEKVVVETPTEILSYDPKKI